jgi:hypothetical protein
MIIIMPKSSAVGYVLCHANFGETNILFPGYNFTVATMFKHNSSPEFCISLPNFHQTQFPFKIWTRGADNYKQYKIHKMFIVHCKPTIIIQCLHPNYIRFFAIFFLMSNQLKRKFELVYLQQVISR